jgi:hypothetical protein
MNSSVRHRFRDFVLALLVFVLLFPGSAFAYIDPGTGSFLLQMLLAGLFAALYTMRRLRHRIWSFVKGLFGSKADAGNDSAKPE